MHKNILSIWFYSLISLIIISFFVFQFINHYDRKINLLKTESYNISQQLNTIIELSVSHIYILQTTAQNHLRTQASQSKFIHLIQQNKNTYSMDKIPNSISKETIGNLTGIGSFADKNLQPEINTALCLNPLFQQVKKSLPDVTWIYYMSSQGFINLYPWVESQIYHFSAQHYQHDFYQYALPKHNKNKAHFWTKAYIDEAGQGLMVTLAAPVYQKENFKGVVALDITLKSLNIFLEKHKLCCGNVFIVNQYEQVLAGKNIFIDDKEYIFQYSLSQSPWYLVFVLDNKEVFLHVFWETLPGLFISILSLIILLFFIRNQAINIKLYESNQRYAQLFKANKAVQLLINPSSGQIIDANQAACDFYGYTIAQFKNLTIYDINTQDKAIVELKIQQAFKAQSHHFFFQHKLALGAIRVVEVYSGPITIDGQTLLYSIVHDITQRKIAEDKLQSSQAFLQAVLEALPSHMAIIDQNGLIISVNGSWKRFAEQNHFIWPDYGIGKNYFSVFNPVSVNESILDIKQKIKAVLSGKINEFYEEYPCDSPQTQHWFAMRVMRFIDHENNVRAIISHENITEQKQIELALQESEARFRSAFIGAAHGMAIADLQGNITEVNQALCQMLGYEQLEILSKNFSELTYYGDIEKEMVFIDALLTGEQDFYQIEKRYLSKDNRIIWGYLSLALVKDKQEKPLYFVGQIQDITHKKQIEQTLLESEAKFRSAFEDAGHGMILGDFQGRLLKANHAICEMLGYAKEELLQMNIHNLAYPEPPTEHERQEIRALLSIEKNVIHLEKRYLHKNNQIIWTLVTLSIVKNTQEKPLYLLAHFINITDRKQIAENLAQAKAHAEAANYAKSVFLTNMSHELRTPLNAILGYAQLLQKEENLTLQQKEGLEIVENSGRHLLTLINDILDISKIEAGKVELYPCVVNFPKFLQSIVGMMRMSAQEKNLLFIYQPKDIPDYIQVDEKRLRQVLLNLLTNAIKFTYKGSVILQVFAKNIENKKEITFSVQDTGIGISQDKIKKIFLPFEQVNDKNHNIEGTGLGLAISHQLIQLMHGELTVVSELGKGSCFSFTCVFAIGVEEEEKVLMVENIVGYYGKKRRILLADDDSKTQKNFKELLEHLGFIVIVASNGEEVIAKAQETFPDVIFIDLFIPDKNGYEAVMLIKQEISLKSIPIIAISANINQKSMVKNHSDKFYGFLEKPLVLNKVLAFIEEILHLEWKYKRDTPKKLEKNTNIKLPDSDIIAQLYEWAVLGKMRKIEQWAEVFAEKNPEYLEFTENIKQFAKKIEEDKLLEFLSDNKS